MLRRQTVIHPDHDAAGGIGKLTAEWFISFKRTKGPAAAVQKDGGRQELLGFVKPGAYDGEFGYARCAMNMKNDYVPARCGAKN